MKKELNGIELRGKYFVVYGYGWVGRGMSSCLRGLGAIVMITEVNPVKALEAHLDGFNVQRLQDILPKGDVSLPVLDKEM